MSSFVVSKSFLSKSVISCTPSFERLIVKHNCKTVGDIICHKQLFWSLFCKIHYTQQVVINEEMSENLHLGLGCQDDRHIIEITKDKKRDEYIITGSKHRIKHLKVVVENLREVFLNNMANKFSLHFSSNDLLDFHMTLQRADYIAELIDENWSGLADYYREHNTAIGITKEVSPNKSFCENFEYKYFLRTALPSVMAVLGGKCKVELTQIYDVRRIYFPRKSPFLHHQERCVKKYGHSNGLNSRSIESFEFHFDPLAKIISPPKQSIPQIEQDAIMQAKQVNVLFAKLPKRFADFLESMRDYLDVQSLIPPESKFVQCIAALHKHFSVLSSTLSSYFAWCNVMDYQRKLNKITKQEEKITETLRSVNTNSILLREVLSAKIDCLNAQKDYAKLSLIKKLLRLMDKIINNLLTISTLLLACGISLNVAYAGVAGFCVIGALFILKLGSAIYKYWDTFPHFIKMNYHLTCAGIYKLKDLINRVIKVKDSENKSLKVKTLIEEQLIKASQHESRIAVNLIKSKFKTYSIEDLTRLRETIRKSSLNYYKMKEIKKFFALQNIPVPKKITPKFIINYITAEI